MAAAVTCRSVDCSEEMVCVIRRIFRARVTPCPMMKQCDISAVMLPSADVPSVALFCQSGMQPSSAFKRCATFEYENDKLHKFKET